MKDINVDFKNSKSKSILFLGKFNSLTREELELFLDKFDIKYTDTLDTTVEMFVEGTIISPLEEDIANRAFGDKIPNYTTSQFEKLYAHNLNSDSILMSLKLSNNQDRLFRLLHNMHLSDKLFLKLFNMYDWSDEEVFGNSENMEIATLFAKRFYKKKRFDEASFHSPVSLFETAIISEDEEVLEALFNLPNITVKQSRNTRRPANTKEALATNEYLNSNTLKKLLRLNDEGVDYFLAQNPIIDENIAKTLLKRENIETKKALSCNENLSDAIFEALLDEEKTHINLLYCQKIDLNRFKKIKKLHTNIGANENLSDEVILLLIEKDDLQIQQMLSLNWALKPKFLQKLYELQKEEISPYLAKNRNTSVEILKELYKKKDISIDISLAKNPSTPKEILEEFYSREEFLINESLALNESVKLEHLQQLQLDIRLINNLKVNETFIKGLAV